MSTDCDSRHKDGKKSYSMPDGNGAAQACGPHDWLSTFCASISDSNIPQTSMLFPGPPNVHEAKEDSCLLYLWTRQDHDNAQLSRSSDKPAFCLVSTADVMLDVQRGASASTTVT